MTSLEIKDKALQLGFLACGILPVNIFDEYKGYLDRRIASFPESEVLYKPLYGNVHQPENARSIIVCTQRYNKYKIQDHLKGLIGKLYLFDSRVPYSQEYRALCEFESYLTLLGINVVQCTIPVRLAAVKAGLGKLGRNNFVYDPVHGSYIWINVWVIDKELEYDEIKKDTLLPDCNDSCQKCIQACPTKALSGSFLMDRGKCITQLTCYAKNTLSEDRRSQMGSWLYGCDECQDACPCNKGKFAESEEYPLLKEHEKYLDPERILEMDEDTYLNIVHPRFWYIGKDNRWLWMCNALRHMINSGDKKYDSLIKKYCDHPDTRIKEVAQWGLSRL